jgi:GDP-mannose transporter
MDTDKKINADPEMGKLVETTTDTEKTTKDASSAYEGEKSNSAGKALSSCILYTFCSVSMVLVNKSLASSYNHLITTGNLNFLLVVFQAVIAVVAVEFSKKMGWVDYPSFDMKTALQWAPVNLTFCAMLFTGMASLQHNSVPMVTIFKNITNIVVSIGDYYFFGTKVEPMVVVAFSVMLGGALFAAKNDISATAVGLFWMIVNCLATAAYILYMKFATKTVKLSKFGMVFYNNVLCALFLLPVTLFNGEMRVFMDTEAIHTFDYAWKNGFAGFVGFFLNFASLNCVSNTGPTTYAIAGSLNKVPVAILGWIIFAAEITPQAWFFIAVSMCGGFLYSYAKLSAGRRKTKARSG